MNSIMVVTCRWKCMSLLQVQVMNQYCKRLLLLLKRIIVPTSQVINPFGGHQVFFNNETPYVIASSEDTYRWHFCR